MKYEIKNCVVCKDEITHYTRKGGLMTAREHSFRKACVNPACLSELQRKNANKDKNTNPIPLKPCLYCRETISLYWGGCNRKKTRKDYGETKFCSNQCRGEWIARNHKPRPTGASRFTPAQNTPIDRFIYAL